MTEPQQSASSAEALKGKRGLRRLINATGYSIKGIRAGLEHEAAFREEFLLAVILIPTALEAVVDRIGMEIHPLAGRAKDMGSAAVFFALLILAAAWGLIALPALWALFF